MASFFGSISRGMRKLLAPAEDPREFAAPPSVQLDEMLMKVRRAAESVTASKTQLQGEQRQLRALLASIDEAQAAMGSREGSIATRLAEQRALVAADVERLQAHLGQVEHETRRLHILEERMQAQVDTMNTRQEVAAARLSAAEAEVRAEEALSALQEELTRIDPEVEWIELAAEQLQARAAALQSVGAHWDSRP